MPGIGRRPRPGYPRLIQSKKDVDARVRGHDVLIQGRRSLLVVHEEGEQDDDRQRKAEKPKQSAFPEAHGNLLCQSCVSTCSIDSQLR